MGGWRDYGHIRCWQLTLLTLLKLTNRQYMYITLREPTKVSCEPFKLIKSSLFPRQNSGYLGWAVEPPQGYPPSLGSKNHWKSISEGLRMWVLLRENVHLWQTDHFELQSIENVVKTASLILVPFSHSKWTMEASWHVRTRHFFQFLGFQRLMDGTCVAHLVQAG